MEPEDVGPVVVADRIPADFPNRDQLVPPAWLEARDGWVEDGNTVIVGPDGSLIAGPVRQREETLIAELDLGSVRSARRLLDPVGHYNRPDVFRLHVDTSPRPPVVVESFALPEPVPEPVSSSH